MLGFAVSRCKGRVSCSKNMSTIFLPHIIATLQFPSSFTLSAPGASHNPSLKWACPNTNSDLVSPLGAKYNPSLVTWAVPDTDATCCDFWLGVGKLKNDEKRPTLLFCIGTIPCGQFISFQHSYQKLFKTVVACLLSYFTALIV